MLTPEENIRLTETGPETAAGKVLRSYWQPVALTEELDGERPVKAVTLMNEQLVLFKAADGEYRLSGRFCPHRGVDLSYGRLEADGLRCPFHGWLFDGKGHCLEQPAQRIAALSPGATELAWAAGAGDQVVAVVAYSDYPPAAKEVTSVGSHTRMDMERLFELQPDLVGCSLL